MFLDVSGNKLAIRARAHDQDVAHLHATLDGGTLVVTDIDIPREIKIVKKKGFLSKASLVPGRGRGYGTLLIRALLAYARRNDVHEIIGGLSTEDLLENRYALEWYSRRGFITERVATPLVPNSVATIRFVL